MTGTAAGLRRILLPAHRLFERAGGYALNQWIGRPTTDRFRRLIAEEVEPLAARRILDIGCGIGNYRTCFAGIAYRGVDINAAYIETARARFPDTRFDVMDATHLDLPTQSCDAAITIATTHHLDDRRLEATVREALRVIEPTGYFHVIDAVMPFSPNFAFKRFWFGLDRGAFPRKSYELAAILERGGRIVRRRLMSGPLHDTAYFRLVRSS